MSIRAAVQNGMLEGCLAYQREGIAAPEHVKLGAFSNGSRRHHLGARWGPMRGGGWGSIEVRRGPLERRPFMDPVDSRWEPRRGAGA